MELRRTYVECQGRRYLVYFQKIDSTLWVHYNGKTFSLEKKPETSKKSSTLMQDPSKIFASITGKVNKVFVKKGQKVKKGETLLILEAMKMEYDISSLKEGSVKDLFCKEGDQVEQKKLLIEMD